jgi:DNA-binding XRE family transcriptional regulator
MRELSVEFNRLFINVIYDDIQRYYALFRYIWRIMKIVEHQTDELILEELGKRLSHVRLQRNLTQAALAEQAGISKRTVERLESGEVSARLSAFLRVCRVLGLIDQVNSMIPEAKPTPMDHLRWKSRVRKRASGVTPPQGKTGAWTWGDES